MNQKRSCPGTPKRYRTRLSLIVIRPKSRATVVVVLLGRPRRLSRPTLAVLSGSSVSSGRTSLMALTSVVLPAPKPPAMRILCAVRVPSLGAGGSEGAKAIEYLLEHVVAWADAGRPLPEHGDRPGQDQVAEQDAHHAEGQAGAGRDVGHRGLPLAQGEDPAVLRRAALRVVVLRVAAGHGDDHGDHVEHLAVGRLRSAAGHRVGAHDRAGIAADPPSGGSPARGRTVGGRHRAHSPAAVVLAGNRECETRCGLARLTSIAISYATMPASASAGQSAARQLPSPAAITNSSPCSSSMTVCLTPPALKRSPVPVARLCRAAATAARCSASSLDRSVDAASSSPSLDRMTARVKSLTRDARSSSSHARSRSPAPSSPVITLPPRCPAPIRRAARHSARQPRQRHHRQSRHRPGFCASFAAATRRTAARRLARVRPLAPPHGRGRPGGPALLAATACPAGRGAAGRGRWSRAARRHRLRSALVPAARATRPRRPGRARSWRAAWPPPPGLRRRRRAAPARRAAGRSPWYRGRATG